MKIRNIHAGDRKTGELTITAMIDVVFLLLAFFIMTFKIVAPEGDFRVNMPQAAPVPITKPYFSRISR